MVRREQHALCTNKVAEYKGTESRSCKCARVDRDSAVRQHRPDSIRMVIRHTPRAHAEIRAVLTVQCQYYRPRAWISDVTYTALSTDEFTAHTSHC